MKRFPRLLPWSAVPFLGLAAWLMVRHGFENLFTKPLGRSDAARLAAAPITGGSEKTIPYYNLRPVLSLLCLCLHAGAMAASGLLRRLPEKWARGTLALGRYALEAYVMHLAFLAALVVGLGIRPLKTAREGDAVLLGVAALCWAWAGARESGWLRYRRGTQSASASEPGPSRPASPNSTPGNS